MTKNNKKLIGLVFLSVFGGLVLFLLKPECVFLKTFGIRCPACGMTRALELVFKGRIIESFYYNIFGFLFVIFGFIIFLVIFIDIFYKRNYLEALTNFFIKYYWIIILLFLISMIVNNFRQI